MPIHLSVAEKISKKCYYTEIISLFLYFLGYEWIFCLVVLFEDRMLSFMLILMVFQIVHIIYNLDVMLFHFQVEFEQFIWYLCLLVTCGWFRKEIIMILGVLLPP